MTVLRDSRGQPFRLENRQAVYDVPLSVAEWPVTGIEVEQRDATYAVVTGSMKRVPSSDVLTLVSLRLLVAVEDGTVIVPRQAAPVTKSMVDLALQTRQPLSASCHIDVDEIPGPGLRCRIRAAACWQNVRSGIAESAVYVGPETEGPDIWLYEYRGHVRVGSGADPRVPAEDRWPIWAKRSYRGPLTSRGQPQLDAFRRHTGRPFLTARERDLTSA